MYGEKPEYEDSWTKMSEDRGGSYYFPKRLSFPDKERIELMLKVREYTRYNKIIVCKKGAQAMDGLPLNGRGAFEVYDFAFCGFTYGDDKKTEVEL